MLSAPVVYGFRESDTALHTFRLQTKKKRKKEAKRASVVDSEFASRVVGCVTKAGKSN